MANSPGRPVQTAVACQVAGTLGAESLEAVAGLETLADGSGNCVETLAAHVESSLGAGSKLLALQLIRQSGYIIK